MAHKSEYPKYQVTMSKLSQGNYIKKVSTKQKREMVRSLPEVEAIQQIGQWKNNPSDN